MITSFWIHLCLLNSLSKKMSVSQWQFAKPVSRLGCWRLALQWTEGACTTCLLLHFIKVFHNGTKCNLCAKDIEKDENNNRLDLEEILIWMTSENRKCIAMSFCCWACHVKKKKIPVLAQSEKSRFGRVSSGMWNNLIGCWNCCASVCV